MKVKISKNGDMVHQTRSKTKGYPAVIGVNNLSTRKAAKKKDIRSNSTRDIGDKLDKSNPADYTFSAGPKRRVKSGISKVSTSIVWTCRTCAFKNSNSVAICTMCGTNSEVTPLKAAELTMNKNVDYRKCSDPRYYVEHDIFETFREIMKKFESTQTKFVDDSFPASSESLYINKIYPPYCQVSVTKWLRPEYIQCSSSQPQWTVIKNPVPSDIRQGYLGDCWFVAAMDVVAEREDLLNNILKTKVINPAGAYIIRLNKDGRWKDVIVDDLLPCEAQDQLIYAKSIRKQLWVPLIEKAMAKLNGSYEALCKGSADEGLMTLTGYHCGWKPLQTQNLDLTWRTILSNRTADFLMLASTNTNETKNMEELSKIGLRLRHVYSILDVVDVDHIDECNRRLIKLRDPHGKTLWNGNWSDKSSNESHHGIFWMCLQDFLKYFYYIHVCRIRKRWNHYSFQGVFACYAASHHPVYSIKVSQTTEIDVAIILQNRRRKEKELGTQWKPNELIMALFQASTEVYLDSNSNLVQYASSPNRSVDFCCVLDPGQYYLVPVLLGHRNNDADKAYVDFEVSIYSSRKIECSPLQDTLNPFVFADAIIAMAICYKKVVALNPGTLYLYSLTIYVIENADPIKWLACEVDLFECSGYQSTRGVFKTFDSIPPRSRQVVNVLIPVGNAYGVCKHKTRTVATAGPGLTAFGEKAGINHVPYVSPRILGLHFPRRMYN